MARLRMVTVLVAALALTITATPAAAALPTGSSNYHDPGFYQAPERLPERNGDLITSAPVPLAVTWPELRLGSTELEFGPARAERIMYRSTGARGDAVPVSGTYFAPTAPWEGPGPRPLAVVAPGTMGQAAQCGASVSFPTGLGVSVDPAVSLNAAYEYFSTYNLISRGFAVVVTDYEGLGMSASGLHPYVHREASAHAVLDAARAAKQLPGNGLAADSPVVMTGYSQGGGSVAAAAELQPTYAPDVDLRGTVSGAPPADLAQVLKAVDGSTIAGVIGYSLNTLTYAYPELDPILQGHLNDQGKAMLHRVRGECIGETILHFAFQRTTSFTKSGESASEILDREPLFKQRLAEQRIGLRPPKTPVMVVTGRHDDAIPYGQVRTMAGQWCEGGTRVQMRVDETPLIAPGTIANHGPAMVLHFDAVGQYLVDRVHGVPAPSNCGRF